MDKNQTLLDILVEAQKCRTISEIAKKLYISQPYVTQLIQEEERKYQVSLINRTKLPISLTPAGKTLLNYLTKILRDQHELENEMYFFSKKYYGKISIAVEQPMDALMIPDIFTSLYTKFNQVQFDFSTTDSTTAQQMLLGKQIDIYVGRYLTNNEIKSETLSNNLKPSLIIPEKNPLYNKFSSTEDLKENIASLENADFIGINSPSYFQDMTNTLFNGHNIPINIKAEAPTAIATTLMALKSDALAITFPVITAKLDLDCFNYKVIPIPNSLYAPEYGVSCLATANNIILEITAEIQKLVEHFLKQYSNKQ